MTAFSGSHLQLRAELRDISPAIWRRLVVPADATLDVVHQVLQIAFGWKDSHLHDFHVGEVRFGMTGVDDELLAVDEHAAPLGEITRSSNSKHQSIGQIRGYGGIPSCRFRARTTDSSGCDTSPLAEVQHSVL
jgi:hypothetical protein